MLKKLIWILVILLVLAGGFVGYVRFFVTKRPHSKSPVVARVGEAVLTAEDIQKRIPSEYSDFITYEQNVDYVKRWIDSEILYQTALQRRIDQEPEVKQRLEKMRKDLLMSEMISRLVAQMGDVTDADIEKYYQDNSSRFQRKDTEIRFAHICVRTLAEAWRVRDRITPDNFFLLGKEVSIEPMEDTLNLPYVTKVQVTPELADVIFDIKIGGTTPPIKTPGGYYIVKILDKQVAGSVKPLKTVREEILNQISTQTQRVRLDEIIASLKKRLNVEYHLNTVPGKIEGKGAVESAPSQPVMEPEGSGDTQAPAAPQATKAEAEKPASSTAVPGGNTQPTPASHLNPIE